MEFLNNKKIKSLAFLVLITSIFIFNFQNVLAGDLETEEKLSQTKEDVEKLFTIKDDSKISDEDKVKSETDLRIKIVKSVIDLSLGQVEDSKEKLEMISFPQTDDWTKIREKFIKTLDEFSVFYKDQISKIDNNDQISIEDLKEMAKNIETKKTLEIDAFLYKLNNVIAVFNISEILELADQRLEKVSIDINKIYSKKLTKNPALKNLLDQASGYIEDGHQLNDKSKEIIFNVYAPIRDLSVESFFKNLKNELDKNNKFMPSNGEEEVIQERASKYIENIISQSFEKIMLAYDVFIKMSLNAKNLIK
ncbi:MAG: hypothetical protein WC705_02890 [Candidatus Paceibacterota bacterium]|jgi:hypothetical protein